MKRNLISELQQRSLSIFLKCRAPCAAARSLAANGRSPPPTAASPASWAAATPPSAPAWPRVALPTAATQNRPDQVPRPPIRLSGHSTRPDQLLAACSRPQTSEWMNIQNRPSLARETMPGLVLTNSVHKDASAGAARGLSAASGAGVSVIQPTLGLIVGPTGDVGGGRFHRHRLQLYIIGSVQGDSVGTLSYCYANPYWPRAHQASPGGVHRR